MPPKEPLCITLEFARAEQAGDPFGFRFAPQPYLLRSANGGFESTTLNWSQELLADLEAARTPDRDPVVLSRLGEALRRFLSAMDWSTKEAQILAALEQGRRVLLSVRSAAAELYALPWELLTSKATGQHLGELPELLIRYEWPETKTEGPEPGPGRDRILLAWSAAGGAVPASEHIKAVLDACRAGVYEFVADRDVLPNTSCGRLSAALAAAAREGQPIAVLHLLCHGSATGSTFGLALDGSSEGKDLVDAGRLRQILVPHAATLRLVVLSACDSGNSGAVGNQLGSLAQTLHRAGIAAVVASRYPLSVSGSIRFAKTFYEQLLQGPESLETSFLVTRRSLREESPHLDWASLQLYARAADGEDSRPLLFRPFRGLLAFQREHQRFFFGREREIDQIVSDLAALRESGKPRLLVVAGASGSGKSSAVLAGAVPRLLRREHGGFGLQLLRPGSDPLAALDGARKGQEGDPAAPRLVLVDQFEEIFTHVTDPAVRQEFVSRLWELCSARDSRDSVLLTLRIDYLGRCGEIFVDRASLRLDRIVYEEAHRVLVAQLDPSQMQTAIEAPLQRVGLKLEEGLLSRLQIDAGAEPGALPLLQDTLDLLWQRRRGRFLTQQAYDELGGIAGALQGRADALINACSDAEQRVARRLLLRLVNMNLGQDAALATRRRVALAALRPTEASDAACFYGILKKMVAARLLVTSEEGAEQMIEVAHEALIRRWPRLHEWLRSDATRLAALDEFAGWVRQWREHGTLLVGEQFAYADLLAQRYQEELGTDARNLLAVSRQHLQSKRRLGWLWVGLAVFIVFALGYGLVIGLVAANSSGDHGWRATVVAALMQLVIWMIVAAIPASILFVIVSAVATAQRALRSRSLFKAGSARQRSG